MTDDARSGTTVVSTKPCGVCGKPAEGVIRVRLEGLAPYYDYVAGNDVCSAECAAKELQEITQRHLQDVGI